MQSYLHLAMRTAAQVDEHAAVSLSADTLAMVQEESAEYRKRAEMAAQVLTSAFGPDAVRILSSF